MRRMLPLVFAMICLPSAADAQADSARVVAGAVRRADGTFLQAANVFLLETLDGALSDAQGRFSFATKLRGAATLVVLHAGFFEYRRAIDLPLHGPIDVMLEAVSIPLPPLHAQASRFAAGNAPDVALTTLQVVTTPGAAADVYRAVQTFPGLQAVDEGAGLFVRGGDVVETRVLLDDGLVLSPYRYESPTGGFFGAFDPFLLDGIFFSSGGFGARHGDALSGILALETLGRPERNSAGATASLANFSGTAALALPHGLGARATATRSHTHLLFELNPPTTEFTAEPQGRDLSASLTWDNGSDREIKVFALDQWNRIGVVVTEPSYRGSYDANEVNRSVMTSWLDRVGIARTSLTAGVATSQSEQGFGNFQLDSRERFDQLRAHAELPLGLRWNFTLGGEVERRTSRFIGTFPRNDFDPAPGGPVDVVDSELEGVRDGWFAEAVWRPLAVLRLTGGLRTDRSTLPGVRTWDPRLAAALLVSPVLTLTAAWGIYHQVPAPLMYEPVVGVATLRPMRATHGILGAELDAGEMMFRVEAYAKRYSDLAQWTRDGDALGGGTGRTHGVDAFLKWQGWSGLSGRAAYSWLRARRTDPDSRTQARSPYDITHGWSTVVEQRIGSIWSVSAAYRSATGRPFTPVVSASFDDIRDLWVPLYGAPKSERLPGFRRLDASASRLIPMGPTRMVVLFIAISNLTDRGNVHDLRYSADFSERIAVRSGFDRSIYFGASLTF